MTRWPVVSGQFASSRRRLPQFNFQIDATGRVDSSPCGVDRPRGVTVLLDNELLLGYPPVESFDARLPGQT
jgi:hypothetical protein